MKRKYDKEGDWTMAASQSDRENIRFGEEVGHDPELAKRRAKRRGLSKKNLTYGDKSPSAQKRKEAQEVADNQFKKENIYTRSGLGALIARICNPCGAQEEVREQQSPEKLLSSLERTRLKVAKELTMVNHPEFYKKYVQVKGIDLSEAKKEIQGYQREYGTIVSRYRS